MIDLENKIISGENYAKVLASVKDGYTIRDCQLSQNKSLTKIFEGVKGLNFESGNNLRGCVLPPDAIVGKDNLYDPDPKSPLQQDIIEETEQQLADSAKKMELEQQVIDLLRTTVKAEIVKADLTKATPESVKASVITASTVAGK